jgi:MoaA/NifB/PqqE/SkfB family radical SAM enzyme
MADLDKKIISAYNKTRGSADKSVLCHAPFTNINFEQTGKATACCYNRKHLLGTYPATSLSEMWYGEQAELLRDYIRKDNLEEGCRMCKLQLESHNYAGFKAKLYDQYAQGTAHKAKSFLNQLIGRNNIGYPKVMEFELENTCNLECIMCNGDFSSSIRKNRENRAPLQSPYDAEFVRQLTEFMPHLTDMKFLGGEPFMIDIYYDIWENVARINPEIKIHITTNATMLNSRTKNLLEKMKVGINISLDSVVKETYEAIRIGANYDRVMDNLNWLIDYTQRKNTYTWFSICPMVINRYEMPGLIQFANDRNIGIYFNTVWWPEDQSLRFLDYNGLDELIRFYEANLPANETPVEKINYDYFIGFINQVKFWKTEKDIPGTAEVIPQVLKDSLAKILAQQQPERSLIAKEILHATIVAYDATAKQNFTADSELHTVDSNNLRDYLRKKSTGYTPEEFLMAYFESLDWVGSVYLQAGEYRDYKTKLERLLKMFEQLNEKKLLMADLIRSGILFQVNYIATTPADDILGAVKSHYN